MLTVSQILPSIAPFVGGSGVCASDPRALVALNEAVRRLLRKPGAEAHLTQRTVRLPIRGAVLSLPPDIAKIIKVRISNDTLSQAYSRGFEFSSSGPGDWQAAGGAADLIDRGFHCTQYDIPLCVNGEERPNGFRLLALSDSLEEPDASLLIRGRTPSGTEARSLGEVGERLPLSITGDTARVTAEFYRDIIAIVKPATLGYVYLSAFDEITGERFPLATYAPGDTNPQFRRYALRGVDHHDHHLRRADALVQMAARPLVSGLDVPLVQDVTALRYMVQAMAAYDSKDINGGSNFEMLAERSLLEETGHFSQDATAEGLDIQGPRPVAPML